MDVIIYASPDLGALMCFLNQVMVIVRVVPQDAPSKLRQVFTITNLLIFKLVPHHSIL
tara:strand:- start:177 stop:350 length:174 start_codon:yes stop_codon:yes gene_type:complete